MNLFNCVIVICICQKDLNKVKKKPYGIVISYSHGAIHLIIYEQCMTPKVA